MRKLLAVLVAVLIAVPLALATDTGTGIGIGFETEEFAPRIWMCDNRKVMDDEVQQGRIGNIEDELNAECAQKADPASCGEWECHWGWCDFYSNADYNPCEWNTDECIFKGFELVERHNNYAFEGEKIEWKVLVMDKNKIEEVTDVVATIGASQGAGNDVEVECVRLNSFSEYGDDLLDSCNARIGEEELYEFNDQTMDYYECTLTVETPDSMYGEYWVTVEAIDATGLSATMDENEYWFLNPLIALAVDGDLEFGVVRPGTIAYSQTVLVGNDADPGSGVLLDMFISGTDFYDPYSSGARCVITNRLKLGDNYVAEGSNSNENECNMGFTDGADHLCYYATNGAYGTGDDPRSDDEGYVPIHYSTSFSTDLYNDAEIIQGTLIGGAYYLGNVLAPGAEIALTFKLGLPEPCTGDFTDGDIYFWGEAI